MDETDPKTLKAVAAIRAVFGDTTVSPDITRHRLETLRDEVEPNLDALGD